MDTRELVQHIMAATGLSMDDLPRLVAESDTPPGATAALVLADGSELRDSALGYKDTDK